MSTPAPSMFSQGPNSIFRFRFYLSYKSCHFEWESSYRAGSSNQSTNPFGKLSLKVSFSPYFPHRRVLMGPCVLLNFHTPFPSLINYSSFPRLASIASSIQQTNHLCNHMNRIMGIANFLLKCSDYVLRSSS